MNATKVYIHFVSGWVTEYEVEHYDFLDVDFIREYIEAEYDLHDVKFVTIGSVGGYKVEF